MCVEKKGVGDNQVRDTTASISGHDSNAVKSAKGTFPNGKEREKENRIGHLAKVEPAQDDLEAAVCLGQE